MSEVVNERRIYIHREALGIAASHNRHQARATSRALAGIRLAKIAHHHLVDNGTDLGAIRPDTAKVLLPITVGQRKGSVTTFLQELTYVPKLPWREQPRLPVLFPNEVVVDTCFQDGYYTIATGPEAAVRMFEDRVPMPELKQSIAAGTGPDDLTIITAKGRLAIDSSANTTQAASDHQPIDLAQAREIDMATLQDISWSMRPLVEEVRYEVGGFTELEEMVTQGLIDAVKRTFETSSY